MFFMLIIFIFLEISILILVTFLDKYNFEIEKKYYQIKVIKALIINNNLLFCIN